MIKASKILWIKRSFLASPSCLLRSLCVKALRPFKNCFNYIDVSHSRQPLVKGERLVRCERKTATNCEATNAATSLDIDSLQLVFSQWEAKPEQRPEASFARAGSDQVLHWFWLEKKATKKYMWTQVMFGVFQWVLHLHTCRHHVFDGRIFSVFWAPQQ